MDGQLPLQSLLQVLNSQSSLLRTNYTDLCEENESYGSLELLVDHNVGMSELRIFLAFPVLDNSHKGR